MKGNTSLILATILQLLSSVHFWRTSAVQSPLRTATVNQQHPLAHYEGWMANSQETVFLLDSRSLSNHGGYLRACFTTYLPTAYKQVVNK
jgi:hypothetical protein